MNTLNDHTKINLNQFLR